MSNTGEAVSDRQKRFVDACRRGLEPRAAAIAAGYQPHAAAATATRLMRKPTIQRQLNGGVEATARQANVNTDFADISLDKIISELACMAFADIREFLDYDGAGIRIRPSEQLDAHAAKAIAEVVETRTGGEVQVRVKLYDKKSALDKLANIVAGRASATERRIDAGALVRLTPDDLEKLADDLDRLSDQ